MADNLTTQSATPATVPSASVIATDDVSGVHFQRVKLVDGTLDSNVGIAGDATNGLDVDVTRVQGTVTVSGPLTDAQLRASAVPVSGTFYQATQPVSGPLTDAELRASAVPVGGTVTVQDGGNSITVDGSVTVSNFPASQAVTGTFWQATQPVSWTGSPTVTQTAASTGGVTATNITSAATSTNLTTIKASTGVLYGLIVGNTSASPRWVKVFANSGSPTMGTTSALMDILVPGNTSGAGLVMTFDSGIAIASGLYVAITAGAGLTNNTVTTGTETTVNVLWK